MSQKRLLARTFCGMESMILKEAFLEKLGIATCFVSNMKVVWNLDTKVGDLEAAEAVLERMRRTKNRKEQRIEIPCVATHFIVVVPTVMTGDRR